MRMSRFCRKRWFDTGRWKASGAGFNRRYPVCESQARQVGPLACASSRMVGLINCLSPNVREVLGLQLLCCLMQKRVSEVSGYRLPGWYVQ